MASDVFIAMDSSINLEGLLIGSDEQVAGRFNSLYSRLERLQAENSELFNRVGVEYKVMRQNVTKDHKRYLNLLSLNGSDQGTLDLLKERANDWMENPWSFWSRPELVNTQVPGAPSHLDTQAQIVGHYMQAKLLVEFRHEIGNPSIDITAHFLHYSARFCRDIEEATRTLNTMIESGSKYKQLENLLGAGVCFVLPTNIGETNWTKILTKSTERNRTVVEKLKRTNIPRLAVEYAPLRGQIVGAKMAELRIFQHAPPQFTTATSQQLFMNFNPAESLYWEEALMQLEFEHGTMGFSPFGI